MISYDDVKRLLREVQAKTPLTGDVPVMVDWTNDSGAASGNFGGTPTIIVNPLNILHATDDMMRGTLAHELGHIVNGDIWLNRDSLTPAMIRHRESEADHYAVKLGFGQGLLDDLQASIDSDMIVADPLHPHPDTRVKNLKKWIAESK